MNIFAAPCFRRTAVRDVGQVPCKTHSEKISPKSKHAKVFKQWKNSIFELIGFLISDQSVLPKHREPSNFAHLLTSRCSTS